MVGMVRIGAEARHVLVYLAFWFKQTCVDGGANLGDGCITGDGLESVWLSKFLKEIECKDAY